MRSATLILATLASFAAAFPRGTHTTSESANLQPRSQHLPSTNGERFAAGLPPVAPKRRFHQAHHPRSSPIPPPPGSIEVKALNGTSLGFIQSPNSVYYGVGTTSSSSLSTFTVPNNPNVNPQSELNIEVHGPVEASYPYFVAVESVIGYTDIGTGSLYYLNLTPGQASPPGATPQSVPNGTQFGEEAYENGIWTYDTTDNSITAQWVNSDGSRPTTSIALFGGVTSGHLVLTGDINKFVSTYGTNAEEVTFTLIL